MSVQNDKDAEIKCVAEKFWNYLEDRGKSTPEGIVFQKDKKKQFVDSYIKGYNEIISKYMEETTRSLDSHKSAALFVIQCLKNEIYKEKEKKAGTINIFPQVAALDIAFEFMLICLNENLRERKIRRIPIKAYILPIPYSCNKSYLEVMSRILYYEGMDDSELLYNIFELSDRLFMIEYLTLLQEGIEPMKLKD